MLSLSSPLWLLALLVLPLVWWLHRFHEHDQAYQVAALFLWASSDDGEEQRGLAREAEPIWLLRALTASLLVLALCGPQWAGRDTGGLTVWIDDSRSMFSLERGIPRMQQALTDLEQLLAERRFSSILLRSLAAPGQALVLELPEELAWRGQLRAWASAPRGEPKLPVPVLMDSARMHCGWIKW